MVGPLLLGVLGVFRLQWTAMWQCISMYACSTNTNMVVVPS